MTISLAPVFFSPDVDNAWSVAPGALTYLNNFAPLTTGAYGSMGTASLFALTGSDILRAQLFRKVDGNVRMLVFRPGNIDEYDTSGFRTNRGTGYSNAAGVNWRAAAWGDQIIAVDYEDATQSSTGTSFSALGAGSPKARYIAANIDFVMLADTNDGSEVLQDQVWWCARRNPNSWTPDLTTSADAVRLLAVPGPIRQLVAFRNVFVAFKDNGILLGTDVGPPYTFNWQVVSNKIGCSYHDSVAEVDGKLYFLHTSGFYEFDGQSLRNVGLPVHRSFLTLTNYLTATGTAIPPAVTNGFTLPSGTGAVQATGDDIEGIYWILVGRTKGNESFATMYGYNVRTERWGVYHNSVVAESAKYPRILVASTADMQTFHPDSPGRVWTIWNAAAGSTFRSVRYPSATTESAARYVTGRYGSRERSARLLKHYWRTLAGTTVPDATMTAIAYGYATESVAAGSETAGPQTAGINTELDEADVTASSRYVAADVSWTLGSTTILAAAGWGDGAQTR